MAIYEITSLQNPRVKQARALLLRKEREATGLFLVEGIRHVGEAVQAGAEIETIFYAPEILTSPFAWELLKQAQDRQVLCLSTTAEVFEKLAEKSGPQGIVAVVRRTQRSLDTLTAEQAPWVTAVVAPQDPGNIGTILRTLDAVGGNALVLLDGGAEPWHPTAVRASMGALFTIPVVETSFDAFAEWVEQQGYQVYGTSARGSEDYRQVVYQKPCVLLLGSEREGLSETQRAICTSLVRLPMVGRASSLNLSVAAGVLLYQMYDGWVSQRVDQSIS